MPRIKASAHAGARIPTIQRAPIIEQTLGLTRDCRAYWLAEWLLLFGHGVVLSMKEKAQRWAGLVVRPHVDSSAKRAAPHYV